MHPYVYINTVFYLPFICKFNFYQQYIRDIPCAVFHNVHLFAREQILNLIMIFLLKAIALGLVIKIPVVVA